MNKKLMVKLIMDLVMTVIMIILMGYSVTGGYWHEVLGVIVLLLILKHNVMNIKFFIGVFKNRNKNLNYKIYLKLIMNILLTITTVVLGISSIIISNSLFTFLGLESSALWVYLHTVSAYTELILISVHVGLHWEMIMNAFRKMLHINEKSAVRTFILRVLAFLLAVLGVKASFDRGIANSYIPVSSSNDVESVSEISADFYASNVGNTITEESSSTTATSETETATSETATVTDAAIETTTTTDTETELIELTTTTSDSEVVLTGGPGGHGGHGDQTERSFTGTVINEDATVNDFLGTLTCTGCNKNCSLLAPQCGTGTNQAEQATAYYESYFTSAESSATTEDTTDDTATEDTTTENTTTEDSLTTQDSDTTTDSTSDQTTTDDASVTDSTTTDSQTLNEYLGSLYCDGCGKHCSLLSPQCNIGVQQAEVATEEYESTQTSSVDSTATESSDESTIVFDLDSSEDDSVLKLFSDYIPIMGLYIAGTYYTLKVIDRAKKKNE